MGLIAETKKAMRDSPPEVFNAYIFFCTWAIALSGVAKGFDEGNIASLVVQDRFKHDFGIYSQSTADFANTKGWRVAIATAGAVLGCLGCTWFNDRFGRRWALRGGTAIYMAGILGQGLCSGSLGGRYASRVVAGVGIGVTTVVPPLYISEIASKAIRGLLTLQYAACQQLGVVLGFFINYGVTRRYAGTRTQWMLPTLLQLLPAALWGLGTFAVPESPRCLLSKSRRGEAARNLSKLRNLPAGASSSSSWPRCSRSGPYSPTIFGYLGVTGTESKFLATGIYGVVKFASCLAMPSLLAATHKWDVFVFFGSVCAVSLIYVFYAMPDTTGRSLESLDALF